MVFDTPIKGRRWVCSDIYGKNPEMAKYYQKVLKKGLDQIQKKEVEDYYKAYLSFKINQLDAWFRNLNKKRRHNYFSLKNLTSIFQGFKGSLSNRDIPSNVPRDPNIPYILFLLPKPNHWATSFMNPELLDQGKVVTEVSSRITKGFNLVIKTHPKIGQCTELKKLVASVPNCYLENTVKTDDLVSDAAMVIFYGTTSGVEALMHNKHVIELGKKTLFFDLEDPPVKRVHRMSKLSGAIDQCMQEPTPKKQIDAYFYSILKTSSRFSEKLEKIDIHKFRADNHFEEMGRLLLGHYQTN
jgi:hypothetical protein